MMEYETFKNTILERLQQDIPDPKQISVQTVYKNNGRKLDGLVIMEGQCNISPTLYLNYYYESYQAGAAFQRIYEMILENYRQNKPAQSIDISFFTNLEYAKPKIALRLVNREKNEKILRDIPHIPFLDLVVVFYCLISMDAKTGSATILIHNSHLDYWHITQEDLYRIARENTRRLLPPRLNDMNDMIRDLSQGQCLFPSADPGDDPYPMFVLTNQLNLFGAVCILYTDLLKEYAQKADTDFYILPSSIHEVILIPASGENCMRELSQMVREVNSSQLLEEEVLSDHAYYYSRKTNRITM